MSRPVWVILIVACVAACAQTATAQRVPTLPGDCNYDWSVDAADLELLSATLLGPGFPVDEWCHDLDVDGDSDIADFAATQRAVTGTQRLTYMIATDGDDGTEVNGSLWYSNGHAGTGLNHAGAMPGESCNVGLRFSLPDVRHGEEFVYTRLVLPATGYGEVADGVALRVVGADVDGAYGFGIMPPSALPATSAAVDWMLADDWPDAAEAFDCNPLERYSPNIASVINEIVERPDWGTTPVGKTVALTIENLSPTASNYIVFQDYRVVTTPCSKVIAPRLELYRTVRSTFAGEVLLGRPTDDSMTLNAFSLLALDAYAQYGTGRGVYTNWTPIQTYEAGEPIEIVLDDLLPDREYSYRVDCRITGTEEFVSLPERTCRTQRSTGTPFCFTVTADSHIYDLRATIDALRLYRTTLANVARDAPDFHIDLGDTFTSEFNRSRDGPEDPREATGDVFDFAEALDRHLIQRSYLDMVCHSAPFFFAIGNHEGEQGWRLDGSPNNVAIWATNARKQVYPLPAPDSFYAGNIYSEPYVGLRENYYAWRWGDALFIVLDPFWYTVNKPHSHGGVPGTNDRWDWTLGANQYAWLRGVLQDPTPRYKFVFAHHVTGGVTTYGRGGVEAASHALGGQGSFEWGGESEDGTFDFDTERPNWGLPVHALFDMYDVSIFFHGHDHVFVRQQLDGVVYQLCPQPADQNYSEGCFREGLYLTGDKVNNSGHLRVTVSPHDTLVEYVRAYLPGDGPNGEVAYSYTVLPESNP